MQNGFPYWKTLLLDKMIRKRCRPCNRGGFIGATLRHSVFLGGSLQAFNSRFDYIRSRFDKAQENGIAIEQAVKQLDQDLEQLFQASRMQCLPQKEREKLQAELKKTRQSIEEALVKSAQQDESGELALLLRRRQKGADRDNE